MNNDPVMVEMESEFILDGLDEEESSSMRRDAVFSPLDYEWGGNMLFVSEKFLSVLENSGVDNFIATPLHYNINCARRKKSGRIFGR
ncbi:hypothetical protein FH581_014715 [Leptospira weilii]|uniref:hypothetical protein n=1 Tax=Leptospira weilii TaxID=28184 RepID=UPI001EF2F274|nr:hypothetical protein [Leptospira weilii]ULH27796.1 hypothetical protein FH586_15565 [Leptospira weilii]UPY77179.1 hypothetical protein FH581_014715 [Leptospira weilii]